MHLEAGPSFVSLVFQSLVILQFIFDYLPHKCHRITCWRELRFPCSFSVYPDGLQKLTETQDLQSIALVLGELEKKMETLSVRAQGNLVNTCADLYNWFLFVYITQRKRVKALAMLHKKKVALLAFCDVFLVLVWYFIYRFLFCSKLTYGIMNWYICFPTGKVQNEESRKTTPKQRTRGFGVRRKSERWKIKLFVRVRRAWVTNQRYHPCGACCCPATVQLKTWAIALRRPASGNFSMDTHAW